MNYICGMSQKARAYTDKTLKRLFALCGNQCSFPGCTEVMVNTRNAKNSNICHIEAANEGGERYNPNMTDPERADYDNLIVLCVQHHDETNNVEIYTVEKLKEMKKEHESYIASKLLAHKPSMLVNTIKALSDIESMPLAKEDLQLSFDPNDKILFNNLQSNAELIHQYKVYYSKINSIYQELDNEGSIKKEKLLSMIKLVYIQVKGKYVKDDTENAMDIIRANADNIFDDIYDVLYSKLEDSSFWEEEIIVGIKLIMVDAFIRCKILERPI